jgi:hypothetical protein
MPRRSAYISPFAISGLGWFRLTAHQFRPELCPIFLVHASSRESPVYRKLLIANDFVRHANRSSAAENREVGRSAPPLDHPRKSLQCNDFRTSQFPTELLGKGR